MYSSQGSSKLPALLRKKEEEGDMRLHEKFWFKTYAKNTTYDNEEIELIWQSLSTSQIDFFQELCEYFYQEGIKAGVDQAVC